MPDHDPRLMHRSLLDRPLEVSSASGSYLTLASGRRILDGCAGAAVAAIGHGNAEVQAAVVAQMSRVSYVHTMAYTTDSAERLADALLRDRPHGLSKAYLVGSGSEAMDSALKLARQFHVENGQPERKHFVARQQAYHGNTIGAMSVSSNLARKVPYNGALLLDNVSFVDAAYGYRGQWEGETEDEYAARLVAQLQDEFRRVGPDTVAAFIAETVGGATAGCITPPRGYLEGVRRVCDEHGVLLILDEIMCGSGRTGTYFAFEQDGDVRPDLVTLGKGLGGGYAPIAGVLAHQRVVETLRKGTASFNHGHTYQAHPVSCAAALAVLQIIEREGLVAECARKGAWLESELRRVFGSEKHVGDIRGRGLFWGVEFVADRASKEPFPLEKLFGIRVQERALELGLAVYPGRGTADGVKGDHVLVSPPLNISDEDLQTVVTVLKQAYDQAVKGLSWVDGKCPEKQYWWHEPCGTLNGGLYGSHHARPQRKH
ncbi:pyridoxal phosphate-dependent transferase [Stachybotrys elegans]|uniref:Pyridoxal phosphate-dependent transferase n=1 Tax=Stachybotrys elegans TaxID=80388 RepID=A0A8K0WNZ0_9HYPO|nr:pyridoxal phosphate-dependent transferase [Stachybotrys elegans]